MSIEYGRIIPGKAFSGQPTSAGPGAPGTSVLAQNISNVLMEAGTVFQTLVDLDQDEFKAATTYEIFPVPPLGSQQFWVINKVISHMRRVSTVAFSTNRTYDLRYDIQAPGSPVTALASTLVYSLTTTSPGNIFVNTQLENGRSTDMGTSLLTAFGQILGTRLLLVPTAGGTITGGGLAQLRICFEATLITLPVGTV